MGKNKNKTIDPIKRKRALRRQLVSIQLDCEELLEDRQLARIPDKIQDSEALQKNQISSNQIAIDTDRYAVYGVMADELDEEGIERGVYTVLWGDEKLPIHYNRHEVIGVGTLVFELLAVKDIVSMCPEKESVSVITRNPLVYTFLNDKVVPKKRRARQHGLKTLVKSIHENMASRQAETKIVLLQENEDLWLKMLTQLANKFANILRKHTNEERGLKLDQAQNTNVSSLNEQSDFIPLSPKERNDLPDSTSTRADSHAELMSTVSQTQVFGTNAPSPSNMGNMDNAFLSFGQQVRNSIDDDVQRLRSNRFRQFASSPGNQKSVASSSSMQVYGVGHGPGSTRSVDMSASALSSQRDAVGNTIYASVHAPQQFDGTFGQKRWNSEMEHSRTVEPANKRQRGHDVALHGNELQDTMDSNDRGSQEKRQNEISASSSSVNRWVSSIFPSRRNNTE